MKIYISGKISGLEKAVFEAKFLKTKHQLENQGWEVVNPCEIIPPVENPSWLDYMKADVAELLKCDAIMMQPDWQESKGATKERQHAFDYNIAIYYESNGIPYPPARVAA